MTARRIYHVTVEVTAYVVAESSEQAERWAVDNADLLTGEPGITADAREIDAVPAADARVLPWASFGMSGDEHDRTLAEWLAVATGGAK